MDRGLKKGCRTLIDIVLVAVSLLSPWLGSCRKEILVSNRAAFLVFVLCGAPNKRF